MNAMDQRSASTEAVVVNPAKQANTWGMLLHLSMFIPVLGLIAPIAIWQIKKNEFPSLDQHGKNAVNWIISQFILFVAAGVLASFIGYLPCYAIYLVGVVCAIMAAVKANNGEIWKYPLAFEFIK